MEAEGSLSPGKGQPQSPRSQDGLSEQPTPDPLIDPRVRRFAASIRAGKATPRDIAELLPDWSQAPQVLAPFIESPSLPKLIAALKEVPGLHWHPVCYALVMRQHEYLRRLCDDPAAGSRFGYDEHGTPVVFHWLTQLNDARHPREVAAPAKRSGPKAGFRNPHPKVTERVEPEWLSHDFRVLRDLFKTKLRGSGAASRPRADPGAAKEWYRQLAREVADASLTQDVGWWSGWKEYDWVQPTAQHGRHYGASPPKRTKDGDFWVNTSAMPHVIRRYDAASRRWKRAGLESFLPPTPTRGVERWHPALDEALDVKLSLPKGRADCHGKPAYLAYTVLAALLDVTPEKIRDTIETHRKLTKRRQQAP